MSRQRYTNTTQRWKPCSGVHSTNGTHWWNSVCWCKQYTQSVKLWQNKHQLLPVQPRSDKAKSFEAWMTSQGAHWQGRLDSKRFPHSQGGDNSLQHHLYQEDGLDKWRLKDFGKIKLQKIWNYIYMTTFQGSLHVGGGWEHTCLYDTWADTLEPCCVISLPSPHQFKF